MDITKQVEEVENFINSIRSFYKNRGYTEVITPYLLKYPNLDENIFPISCKVEDIKGQKLKLYLHTSPEYSMKKLLAVYKRDIFQICHVFRNKEGGKLNDFEFLMLEYYKLGKDYTYLMEEIEELLKFLFGDFITYRGRKIPTNIERITLKEAYKRYLNLDLELLFEDVETFKKELERRNIHFEPDEGLEELFFRTYVELEKHLGFERPQIVYEFPEPFGALSKCKNGFCERFELYIFGIELANAYTEINNLKELKKRLTKVAKELNLPVDWRFIEVSSKLPEVYSGISVGLDRLLLLMLDLNSINELYYRRLRD